MSVLNIYWNLSSTNNCTFHSLSSHWISNAMRLCISILRQKYRKSLVERNITSFSIPLFIPCKLMGVENFDFVWYKTSSLFGWTDGCDSNCSSRCANVLKGVVFHWCFFWTFIDLHLACNWNLSKTRLKKLTLTYRPS
jgi:hypothetical protein